MVFAQTQRTGLGTSGAKEIAVNSAQYLYFCSMMRSLITTMFIAILLAVTACAQDVPVTPNRQAPVKKEPQKVGPSSTPRLPPDTNKFAVIISGVSGEEVYKTRFAKWTD